MPGVTLFAGMIFTPWISAKMPVIGAFLPPD
jgi:hypothetical protein